MKKLFPTERKESRKSRNIRLAFNFWPCIWCTGSKVTFISGDWKELHVQLSLNFRTRNRVGTVFGGSIYSSVDPYFMLLLMEVLGKNYVVWDKAASFKFVRPISGKVKCRFLLEEDVLDTIVKEVGEKGEYSVEFPLKYEDEEGKVYAVFSKTVYVANKNFYKQKVAERKQ